MTVKAQPMTTRAFKEEVLTLAKIVNVTPKEIHVQSMKHKWASCSNKGRLTFDKSLLDQPDEVRLKIILHELLHLKYPNHGKMFKSLLATYLARLSQIIDPNLGLGCGNPVALSTIKEGDGVLNLESGAGFDAFLAAKKVGHS